MYDLLRHTSSDATQTPNEHKEPLGLFVLLKVIVVFGGDNFEKPHENNFQIYT